MGDNSDAFKRIFDKLDDIGKKVNSIDVSMAKLEARLSSESNRIDRLEDKLDSISKSHTELKDSVKQWQNWFTISGKIIATVSLIGGAILVIIRINAIG